jgi:hypothetical protein
MNIDSSKWADRVLRPPKTGADYTSIKGNQEQNSSESTDEIAITNTTDNGALNQVRVQMSDMHLVMQLLEQRIDRLEEPDVQQRLFDTERKLRFVQTMVLIVAAILAFFMIREALVAMGVNIGAVLQSIAGN